jgi:biopolymer transport protein ExbB/TolQ
VIDFSVVAAFYREGGEFMHFILATAVAIVAIGVERMIVILRAGAVNSRKLTDDMVAAVGRGDLAGARNLSLLSKAPVARVAQAILMAGPGEESRLQAAADDAATLALPPLSRRLAHLNMLANVATLLGLLGTIFGLMMAFSSVSAADPAQRSAFLAAGISQALNTTAFGLLVAVPTLLLHGWLASMVEGIADQIDDMSIRLGRALALAAAGRGTPQVVAMPAAPAGRAVQAGTR